MEKLELKQAIEKKLEEICALQVQKENIEYEYQLKQSTLDIFEKNKNIELKKGHNKRRIVAGTIGALTFISLAGIMPSIADYMVSLPNVDTSALMYEVIKSFSVEGVFHQAVLSSFEAVYSFLVGCCSGFYLEERAEKKVQKKLGNFDETAYAEIKELEEMRSKVETELTYHKNELMWYQNNLQTVTAIEEKLDQGMLQYNAYSKSNAEIDIIKKPYTK